MLAQIVGSSYVDLMYQGIANYMSIGVLKYVVFSTTCWKPRNLQNTGIHKFATICWKQSANLVTKAQIWCTRTHYYVTLYLLVMSFLFKLFCTKNNLRTKSPIAYSAIPQVLTDFYFVGLCTISLIQCSSYFWLLVPCPPLPFFVPII